MRSDAVPSPSARTVTQRGNGRRPHPYPSPAEAGASTVTRTRASWPYRPDPSTRTRGAEPASAGSDLKATVQVWPPPSSAIADRVTTTCPRPNPAPRTAYSANRLSSTAAALAVASSGGVLSSAGEYRPTPRAQATDSGTTSRPQPQSHVRAGHTALWPHLARPVAQLRRPPCWLPASEQHRLGRPAEPRATCTRLSGPRARPAASPPMAGAKAVPCMPSQSGAPPAAYSAPILPLHGRAAGQRAGPQSLLSLQRRVPL